MGMGSRFGGRAGACKTPLRGGTAEGAEDAEGEVVFGWCGVVFANGVGGGGCSGPLSQRALPEENVAARGDPHAADRLLALQGCCG